MYGQNQVEPPWGDAYQSPCGAGVVMGGGLVDWLSTHLWLALALAAAAGAWVSSVSKGRR